jgi:hypothetical protein
MNAGGLLVPILALGAYLAILPPAGAHRLDEYLQATRLSIDLNRIDVEMI